MSGARGSCADERVARPLRTWNTRGTDVEQVNDLLGAARAATGLEHFGDDSFMDGLERCVRAFREEAHLTAAGEAAIRGQIVGLLSQRLHIEDWYRRHPEIEEEPIEAPLFGVSLPRTGSEPPNEMKAPASSALTAGLSTQLGTKANLRIDDDQALVITTTPGARASAMPCSTISSRSR